MLDYIIVIPARYKSSRFPGKPLALIKGKTLLERVWDQCSKAAPKDKIYIATDNKKTYGFIAQDVEKVIPNIVDNNDFYKTMDYMAIMPFLVESIREQQKQIQTLKKIVLKLVLQRNQ